MTNKIRILIVLSLISLGLVFFFFILEPTVETRVSGLFPLPARESGFKVPELHKTLFVSDLHADTLLWGRDLLKKSSRGHVDIPRLQEGGVALQAFSVVTKAPLIFKEKNDAKPDGITLMSVAGRWPPSSWTKLSERALYQARKLHEAVADSNGELRLILSKKDLIQFRKDRGQNPRLVGAWLTIEGGHALDGDLALVDKLFEAGFRMIGPVHLFDNELGGSRSGQSRYGLTELGRQWLKKAEEKKIIVDLAHMSDRATSDILGLIKRPPMVSHTGVQAVCPTRRNLTDFQIRNIAKKGGLIGIGLWREVLCEESLAAFAKSARHVCRLVGCKHVAIGSDWDGYVTTAVDSAHTWAITAALQQEGFTEGEIKAIMGENVYEFLVKNLP
jgi:membrane dipeptidase